MSCRRGLFTLCRTVAMLQCLVLSLMHLASACLEVIGVKQKKRRGRYIEKPGGGKRKSNLTLCGRRYFVLSSLELHKLLVASGGLSCGENRPQLPHSLTIDSASRNLPSLPLSGGRNKQNPPPLHSLSVFHFLRGREDSLKIFSHFKVACHTDQAIFFDEL